MNDLPKPSQTPFVGRRVAATCPKCSHSVGFDVAGYLHIDGIRYLPLEIFEAWRDDRPNSYVADEWTAVVRVR